jgi:putative transposase
MTYHVHLLCTPRKVNAVSQMMQALDRQYVRYFNHCYKRTGTLWEGRFKSCLVEDEFYLLFLYHYIELNPVRAVTAANPTEHQWSSYQANALGKTSILCTPHSLYIALGINIVERQICY